ncbi:MAG: sulfatase [Candidatus Omnitrophica bacterium]|nr:sulfatase [Candidatus Omnitrophota bacterium]
MRKFFVLLISILFLYFLFGFKKNVQKPNVILITIDSLRPDHLGCYGYHRNTSPNIDKLAREGVIFKNVIAQSNHTSSSLPSIMTSTYLHTHRVYDYGYDLDKNLSTLAEIMKANGYQTWSWIGNRDILTGANYLEHGFDVQESFTVKESRKIIYGVIEKIKANYKKSPIFLWVHYFDTHAPYDVPEPYPSFFPYYDIVNIPILSSTSERPEDYEGRGGIPGYVAEFGITNVDYYIAKYDRAINYVDAQIGLLTETLEKLRLDNRTLIIITADHGEFLGEHNIFFSHVIPMFDEVIKVPLIIKYKGRLPENRVIETQVETIDIMPTILDLVGIKKPPYIQGVNLFSFFRKFKKYALSENGKKGVFHYCIRTNGWKLLSRDINRDILRLVRFEDILNEYNFMVVDKKEFKNIISSRKRINEDLALNKEKISPLLKWIAQENMPILWFHNCENSQECLQNFYENIYLTDLDYCLYLNKFRTEFPYSSSEIEILLEEADKLSSDKVIAFLLTAKKERNISDIAENGNWYKLYQGFFVGPKWYALFNLKEDPKEKQNLFYLEEKVRFLEKKYISLVKKSKKFRSIKINLDKETKERLKGLGYLQ